MICGNCYNKMRKTLLWYFAQECLLSLCSCINAPITLEPVWFKNPLSQIFPDMVLLNNDVYVWYVHMYICFRANWLLCLLFLVDKCLRSNWPLCLCRAACWRMVTSKHYIEAHKRVLCSRKHISMLNTSTCVRLFPLLCDHDKKKRKS